MRWRNAAFAFASLVASTVTAAEPQLRPVPLEARGEGYIDVTGRLAIAGPFAHAGHFAEGVARAAVREGEFGFIDVRGKWRVRPQFEEARDFHEGLVAVARHAHGEPDDVPPRWGFIDHAGKVVVPLRFGAVLDFSEGLAASAGTADGSKWGFIDRTGTMVIGPQFDEVGSFIDGLARASGLLQLGRARAGFIDHAGRWAIAALYQEVHDFSEGLAAVSSDGKRCGYINRSGKMVIEQRFLRCGAMRDGLAHVKMLRGHGFIDAQGAVVIAGPFQDAGDFNGGLAPVALGTGRWGFIDRNGAVVLTNTAPTGPNPSALPITGAEAFDGPLAAIWSQPVATVEALWIDRAGVVRWRVRRGAHLPPPSPDEWLGP